MKTIILFLLIFPFVFIFTSVAHAEDPADWFCVHEAGKREGSLIWSCGVGESLDESGARHNALIDAQREFSDICEMSSDCRGKPVNVDPQRTSCKAHNGHIKCYRLLVITLKP